MCALRVERIHRHPDGPRALDPAAGERDWIEQPAQLLDRQVGHLRGHLEDRPPFGVGLLGDRRALLVADDRVQRRHQDRIAVERLAQALPRSP